ncbi:MAG: flagellar M-ring protein FliF [Solirubrobacteraceae bacterium]|nr:flagellar M-ring protein FliF [Solirubrobacteraceae bacterium]
MNPQAIFKELTPRARIGLGAAALGVVLVLFFLLRLATAPSYVTVMSGIDPGKSDQITTALAERGVTYELRDAGTSLAVEKAQIAEARVALSNAGVSNGGGEKPGFELLDEQKLGASDFQQRVTYQRALEGEIAQTVGAIDGVGGAEVQLTLPEDKLFSSESTPATAAVLLSGGNALDAGAVRGIASLVSSSVSGLKADNVTITDGNGQMLWPNGESAGGSSAKTAAQAKYAAQVENDVNNMLARTLGPNAARVEVAADLNMDQQSEEKLEYAAKGTPLEESKDAETLEGGTPAGATAGTAANIDGAQAAGGNAGSNYDRENTKTTFGVGKTVTKTKVAPGAVNKLQVALLVNDGPNAPANADIEQMVSSAAGLDPQRGDAITTTRFKFADTPAAKSPLPITPTGVLDILKYVLAGLAALVFLFIASRTLRRREATDLAEPRWLSEIEQPRPLSELVAALEAGEGQGKEGQPALAAGSSREQLAAVAAQDPERLARQLRQWMTEDQPS